jgi:hypothetical protein
MPSRRVAPVFSIILALSACSGNDSGGAAGAGGSTTAGGSGPSTGGANAGTGGAGASAAAGAGRGGGAGAKAGSGGAGASGGGAVGSAGTAGASGAGSAGMSGATGNAGAAGSAGAAGAAVSGGRTFSTDRNTFFGATRCAAAGVLLCEDFESGTIDSTRWKNHQTAPVIDAMQAARGSKALHVHTNATGGSGLDTTKIFPRSDGLYYGRMFIYFKALPTSPNYAHWTIIGSNAPSSSSDKSEIRVGGQLENGVNKFGVGTDHGPTGDWTNLDKDKPAGASSIREVPKDEWICIEWMVDTAQELTKFWWDGVEHPSLATTRDVMRYNSNGVKYDLPDIGSVWVGFENYNQGQTMQPSSYDVWIDEVALDAQRIGCSL